MEYTAIDYFDIVPPKDGKPSLVGASLATADKKYLQVSGSIINGTATGMGLTEKLTYQNDTVFSVDTDSYGNTMIGTRLTDSAGKTYAYCLGVNSSDKVMAMPLPDASSADYQTAIKRLQWTVTTVEDPWTVTTSEGTPKTGNGALTKAVVSIQQNGKYLTPSAGGLAMVPILQYAWKLEMQPVGPSAFSYQKSPWTITTDMKVCSLSPTTFPASANSS
jgi:hypothetical protein